MNDRRLLFALAGVFATLVALLLFLGATVTPVAIAVALPFAGVAYLLWYHATGRLEERAYSRARARTADGGRTAGAGARGRSRRAGGARRRASENRRAERGRERPRSDGMSRTEAREVLGVAPGASEDEVRAAYRERVKAVHPDRGGDEAEFQRVKRAYERLRGASSK